MSDADRARMSGDLVRATLELSGRLSGLVFRPPADLVYRPLEYAWGVHGAYLERFAAAPKRVVFLGMNPGPYGMGQTGVPFGDVPSVRDWMGLRGKIGAPAHEHPSKRVLGFGCARREVSGARLWGLFASRFGAADSFFAEHYVHNYCPLLFLENTRLGRNVTPETLPAADMAPVYEACDDFLRTLVGTLRPEWVVGVGGFAQGRARSALSGLPVRIAHVAHPSPANPLANGDWGALAARELVEAGVWRE